MASNLEKIRIEKGLSQNRLAELSGVHQQTISRIEKGGTLQNLRQATKLAKALGCDPSDLIKIDSKYDKMVEAELKNIHKFLEATFELSGNNLRQSANLLNMSSDELKDFQDNATDLTTAEGLQLAFVCLFPFIARTISANIRQGQSQKAGNPKEQEVLEAFRSLSPENQERFINLIKATPLLR